MEQTAHQKNKLAFTFPGQGSHSVGMGKDLADNFLAARRVFEEVDDTLSQNLSGLMWNGPMEELTMTANTQPALMTCSVAAMQVLKHDFDIDVSAASYVAGHSLGEYAALCAAGSLTLVESAKLLRLRGEAMQKAVPVGVGSMAALLGATMEQAEACAKAGRALGICQIANDNATGQVVLSGELAAVELAAQTARDIGVKKAVILPVSAPFHCDLMGPAAEAMTDALADTDLKTPIVPVVNNVTARPVSDPEKLKSDLVAQVTGRVRWRESIELMAADGVDTFAELGAGRVLSMMLKRIVKDVRGTALNSPASLEKFSENYK